MQHKWRNSIAPMVIVGALLLAPVFAQEPGNAQRGLELARAHARSATAHAETKTLVTGRRRPLAPSLMSKECRHWRSMWRCDRRIALCQISCSIRRNAPMLLPIS